MNHDKNVTTTIGHLIDGHTVADTERTQPVFNPATGQSTTSVALASKATVEAAIASAEAAFPAWRNTPPLKRARVMSKLKVLLELHNHVLTDIHHLLPRGHLLVHSPYDAVEVEPPELDGEDIFQNRREEERRQ